MNEPTIIKKYSNRRLYDTGQSRYITLHELAQKIRQGELARVVDAKTGEDLTRATLTQIFVEDGSAGRFFPVALLVQLIRMPEAAVAEFLQGYVPVTLSLYLQLSRHVRVPVRADQLADDPLAAQLALTRMWSTPHGASHTTERAQGSLPEEDEAETGAAGQPALDRLAGEVATLRRELDELRRVMPQRKSTPKRAGTSRGRRKRDT